MQNKLGSRELVRLKAEGQEGGQLTIILGRTKEHGDEAEVSTDTYCWKPLLFSMPIAIQSWYGSRARGCLVGRKSQEVGQESLCLVIRDIMAVRSGGLDEYTLL